MKKYWEKFRALPLPAQWLVYFVLGLLILSFLFAPEVKPVDYRDISFSTTADSRLYFNNIRSYYYHIDNRSKAPTAIYNLKRRSPERDSTNLNFSIIHYPGAEEVFIFSALGKAYEQYENLKVSFIKYPNEAERLNGIDREGHFRIAAKSYSSILDNQAVFLLNGSDTICQLFADKASLLDAEITLEDYFKLTLKN